MNITQQVKKTLPTSKFARSVSVLAGGTVMGQIIVVASSPILTRLYTPEDFGLLAVYAAILGILSVVASLRYQLAIPLPDSNQDAANLAVLSLLSVVIISTLIAAAVALWSEPLSIFVDAPKLHDHAWLIPVGVLFLGFYQVGNYWAIRASEFGKLARTKLTQATTMTIIQVAGYAFGPVALLLGRLFGQGAGVLSLARIAASKNAAEFRRVEMRQIKTMSHKYRHFPLISTWVGLSSSAGMQLPPLLIAAFLGGGAAGFFALAHRVLSQPMNMVGQAVNNVFFKEASQAYINNTLDEVVDRTFSSLVTLSLPITCTIFLVISPTFSFIFGENWETAGDIAQWMVPWLFFQFVVSPSTGIYPIINKHGTALLFQIGLLASSIVSIILGAIIFNNLTTTISIMALTNSFVYLIRVSVTYHIVGISASTPTKIILSKIPISLALNFPIIALIYASDGLNLLDPLAVSAFMATLLLVGFTAYRFIIKNFYLEKNISDQKTHKTN